MPRHIPWLTGGGDTKSRFSGVKVESRSRRKVDNDSDDGDKIPHQTSPFKKRLKRDERWTSRTPSTSPPPAPPPEEYMRPGYKQDDLYRMVEDEFYTVAQQFTSHLHFAEYQRLKKQAKEKSFETILAMRRPVDGKTPLSREAIRKQEVKEQTRKMNEAVKDMTSKARVVDENAEDQARDNDEPYMGTNLQGLMSGEGKKSMTLVGLEGVRSETKASKGFGSPRKDRSKNVTSLFRSKDKQDDDEDIETGTDSEDLVTRHSSSRLSNATSHIPSSDLYKAKQRPRPSSPTRSTSRLSSLSTSIQRPNSKSTTSSRRILDGFDDYLEDIPTTTTERKYSSTNKTNTIFSSSKSTLEGTQGTERESKGKGKEKEKGKMDEIPLFL